MLVEVPCGEAFLKIWPVFIFLIPGLIGYALHQKGLMVIPSKAEGIDGDQVFPTMVSALFQLA